MNELMDLTRHLPTVLAVMAGLGIAYVAYHLAITGPRLQREVLQGLARSGYAPVAPDDAGLLAAVAGLAPHRIHEILRPGESPAVYCIGAMARRDGEAIRYVVRARRFYRYRAASRTNCYETVVLETRPTAVERPFHVNTFAPAETATAHPRVTAGLARHFADTFYVYAEDAAATVPRRLQSAFIDVGPAFLGGIRPTATFPRQPLNTFFIASGWGLCCDVLMDHEQMAELLRVADRLSEGAAGQAGDAAG